MKLRHTLYVVALLLIVLTLSACGSTPTPTPLPTVPPAPTLPPSPTPPKPTPLPTAIPPTPMPPTATPIPAQATSKQEVNVRKGPGVQFDIAGKLPNNKTAVILGKSEDGKWYQIAFPDAANPSWVSVAFVNVTGPVDQLPIVAVARPPTPTIVAAAARTRTPVVTATIAVPAPKGVLSFVSYDMSSQSYSVNNFRFDGRNIAGFNLLGISPADITPLATNTAPFAWSPDGTKAVYVLSPSRTKNALRLFDQAGPRDLFSHDAVASPIWLLDGQTIAYIGVDNGVQTIYTIPSQGGTPRKFLQDPTRAPENYRGLAWCKQWLVFASNSSGSSEIWRANSDGSGAMQITSDKRENSAPVCSPDGTKLAYTSKQLNGSYQIVVANVDGTNPRPLTNAGINFTPAWSPDGNWIAFASNRAGGRLEVYIMDRNGGNVQLLTDKYGLDCNQPQCGNQLPGSWR